MTTPILQKPLAVDTPRPRIQPSVVLVTEARPCGGIQTFGLTSENTQLM